MSHLASNTENLFEFAKILGQQTDFKEVIRLVASTTAQLMKADLALILLLNPDTRKTIKTIFKDGKAIEKKEYRDIHIQVGGWITKNKKSFHSINIQHDDRFAADLFDNIPVKTVAGAPLIIEEIIIGALIILYKNEEKINSPDLIYPLENIATLSAPYLRNTQKIREYFKLTLPESSLLAKYNNVGLYGKSPRFLEMLQSIEAATKCDARVLLVGKTGTGKELIAKAIHQYSARADFPFVAVDCGAIPNNLLESQFFGHKKGAFTGANADHKGFFIEANRGTLFMDEVNNLPQDMQAKLLRVLQESEIRPVGGDKVIKSDVRIIAASSVPLKELVNSGLFREDLFFRLHVYPIYIPDLNDRNEDIPLLASHFLKSYAQQQNKNITDFHEEVIDFIKYKQWNGNIRELENFIERIISLAPINISVLTGREFPSDLHEELNQFRKNQRHFKAKGSLKNQVRDFEAQLIINTLDQCNWNQSEAARQLDTSEKTIRYKIDKLNILRQKTN